MRPSGPGNGPGDGRRTHACRVPGCRARIGTARLMCRPHWHAVPKPLRDRVWVTWRFGAGLPTLVYRRAVAEAITAVQASEARKDPLP
jgi:hypothetical protein